MLLTHSFTPDISPPQRRWSIITEELAQRGHFVTVVTPKSRRVVSADQGKACNNERVKLVAYPSIRRSRTMSGKLIKHAIDALMSVPTAMNARKPDVIIATVPAIPTLMVGFLVSRVRRVPFVVDLRDAWPDLLSESQVIKLHWLEPLISRFISFIVNRSEKLVTVTQGLAQKMQRNGAKNVVTISNGVDTERSDSLVTSREWDGELHILYLGNIGRSQGLETVIRALKHVPDGVHLRIVGQGTEKKNLISLAYKLGVKVDFQEPVYGQEVLENYSWADTCLVSLRPDWASFRHTVPSKLYELLYLNRHVTGLVQGEAAEIIRSSKSGMVVEQNVPALVAYFRDMIANPQALQTDNSARNWVIENASLRNSGRHYADMLTEVVEANLKR